LHIISIDVFIFKNTVQWYWKRWKHSSHRYTFIKKYYLWFESNNICVGFIVNFNGIMYWYLRIAQWYGKKWENFFLHILSY